MHYTEDEKMTAQALVSNPAYLSLIKKIFTETEDKFEDAVVDTLKNEQLGEMVRANSLAERKLKMRYSKLVQMGTKLEGKPSKVKA